ncbi:MAG TPA: amidohydrolase family protein [Ilumatobacteraceae bacterium]
MTTSATHELTPEARAFVRDGYLLLPAFVEPHAHLDKAFLAERVENPTGDLVGAILAMERARDSITVDDTIERAERAARLLLANGCTAIRTHVDLTLAARLTSVAALLDVRDRLRGLIDIQVVALCAWPSIGPEGSDQRALLRDAIDLGIDGIGGCPHLESDPAAANDSLLSLAAEAGLPVDLHTDETLNPAMLALEDLAERVVATGFAHAVAASHCVSLAVQTDRRQQEVAEKVAAAGISVIALPHTNLFLQGRDCQVAMPRAVTAVKALRAAGVNVAAGADNLQDPFNPVGRGDPLETAGLMVMASHVLPIDALTMVTTAARSAIGLPRSGDLVAVKACSVREAIAFGPTDRVLIRDGLVAETERSHDRG